MTSVSESIEPAWLSVFNVGVRLVLQPRGERAIGVADRAVVEYRHVQQADRRPDDEEHGGALGEHDQRRLVERPGTHPVVAMGHVAEVSTVPSRIVARHWCTIASCRVRCGSGAPVSRRPC